MKYIVLILLALTSSAFAFDFDDTKKLAVQGIAGAQFNLGVMYASGEGVPENDAEAVKWYRKAADQGYAQSQLNLGVMYANGAGVPENYIKAHVWWSMAKTKGNEIAKEYIKVLKTKMTNDQIAEGQALASKCYESNYKDCD